MNIIPFRKVILHSRLSKQQAVEQLANNTHPSKPDGFPKVRQGFSTTFTGEINSSSFRIRRVINYGKNSFLPDIKGEITDATTGSEILIIFQLHSFALAFICVWCTLCILGGTAILISFIINDNFTPVGLMPFAMLTFAAILVTFSFDSEYKTARKELERIFDAAE